jgi:hypothetical protein
MLDGRHIGIHWDPTLDDGQSSQREPLAMTITRFKAEIKVRSPAGFTWIARRGCQEGLPRKIAKKDCQERLPRKIAKKLRLEDH